MSFQMSLPLPSRPRTILPSSERQAPGMWVRRVLFLRELQPEKDFVIRSIELRRGLNILWARPASEGDAKPFEGSLHGHTAGKTTFCRMLRYLLGEATFGSIDARQRIRKAFPLGWTIGEIEIADQVWSVCRAFAAGFHPFCGMGTLDDILKNKENRRPYAEFSAAMHRHVVSSWGIERLGATDRELELGHVLPWLTRDQEARFGAPLAWREPSSESDAPETFAADRTAIVRAALSLTSNAEQDATRLHEHLLEERRKARERRSIVDAQAEMDRRRLLERLRELNAEPPELWTAAARALQGRIAELEAETATAEDGELERLYKNSVEAASTVHVCRMEQERTENALSAHRTAHEQLQRHVAGDDARAFLGALPMTAELCNVPLSVARRRGCPLIGNSTTVIDLGTVRNDRAAGRALAEEQEMLNALEATLVTRAEQTRQSEADARRAESLFMLANKQKTEWASRQVSTRSELDSIARDLRRAEETAAAARALKEKLEKLDNDVEKSLAYLQDLRKQHSEALRRVSDCFDLVIQALLGPGTRGEVRESGDEIVLSVDERGERKSTSITVAKVLAFDLAALTASIEGHGTWPRFLLHDGPREADLDPSVYARIFLYARMLEEACGGEPAFQYIVTTTTAPPDILRRAPWLVEPVLDASTAVGRLLGVDL